jgi:hypothetical protein
MRCAQNLFGVSNTSIIVLGYASIFPFGVLPALVKAFVGRKWYRVLL